MTEGHEPAAEGDAAHAGGDDAKKEDKRIAWFVRPPRSHTLASCCCLAESFRLHPGNGQLQHHPPHPPFIARGSRGDLQPPSVENVASFRVAGSRSSGRCLLLLQPLSPTILKLTSGVGCKNPCHCSEKARGIAKMVSLRQSLTACRPEPLRRARLTRPRITHIHFRGPWSLGDLNLVIYFPQGSQDF